MVHNLPGEGTLLFQRPSSAQFRQSIDAIINRQDRVIPLVRRGDDRFHCRYQAGIQGSLPESTESAAWGLGVLHSLPFAGEGSSDRGLGGRADLELGTDEALDGY